LSDKNLIMQLVTASQCEVCGRFFESDNIVILGHEDDMWILQVNCGGCHTQSLLAGVIEKELPPGLPNDLTDLMEAELEKFSGTLVTSNDVLDMLNFLSGFGGDISQLLSQE
jgi:hypothetical protein